MAELASTIVAAIAALDAFEDGLAKLDEKSGVSLMSQLAAGERLLGFLDERTRILWLKTLAAGNDEPVHGVVFTGRRYDTGDRADYVKAVVRLACEPLSESWSRVTQVRTCSAAGEPSNPG